MNGLICNGSSISSSTDVPSTGAMVLKRNTRLKYIRLSNLSDKYVSIAMQCCGDSCPISFGEGIVLAPKGTAGWFIEFNNNNMFYSDIWAIPESGTSKIAVLAGY